MNQIQKQLLDLGLISQDRAEVLMAWSAGAPMPKISYYFEHGSELCGENGSDVGSISFHRWVEEGAAFYYVSKSYYRSGGYDDNPTYRYMYEECTYSGVAMGRCPWATKAIKIEHPAE